MPIHLRRGGGEQFSATYKAINPQALVPALEDGGRILTQSLAIMEYLEERYPKPPLLPADPADRALVRSMALIIACEIHPIQNLRVLVHLKNNLKQSDDDLNRWARHWIDLGLSALEQIVVSSPKQRQVLLWRHANLGGYLPCASAGQRAPFRLRSVRVSHVAANRNCLQRAAGFCRRRTRKTTRRRIANRCPAAK